MSTFIDAFLSFASPQRLTIYLFFIFTISLSNNVHGQIVMLPCQAETDGTIGLDRNNWNGGSTVFHSEGIMHNFDIPTNTFGPCKRISNVEFTITVTSIDVSALDPTCNVFDFFINISDGCGSFAPASCDFVFNQIQGFPVTQTVNFPVPPNTFDFGDIFGADIIPAMSDVNCPNGTSTITTGGIVMDYDICVTVTIVDEVITTFPDLGADVTICPFGTTTLNPGAFTGYAWDPNGEITPTITTGPGTYTVTVTDNNGCTATDEIIVNPFPTSPITFNPTTPMVCDNGNAVVNVSEIYSSYNWDNGMSGQSQTLTTGIYEVTITDANNCTATNSVEVFNVPPPNAGSDNTIEVCDDGSTYDIQALLLAHDPGGTWTDNNGSGLDLNANATAVDFTGIFPSNYTFTYEVPGAGPCPQDQAIISVNVMAQNFAGVSTTEEVCQDPGVLDFFFLLGNPDGGGSWIDQNFSGADLTNPFVVNMNGIAPGTYPYQYIVGNGGACPDQMATLTIIITEGANAGSNAEVTLCEGVQFDLIDLINGPDFSGFFEDTDASSALTGSNVNTAGLAGLSYNFTYIVGSAGSTCGEDEAIFTLNIEASLSAGIGVIDTLCIGSEIDLYDFINNENNGGTFADIDASGGLIGNLLNSNSITSGTYIYRYYIGDGQTCPEDSSEIMLSFNTGPEYDFSISNSTLCPSQCEDIQINFTGSPPFTFPLEVYSATTSELIFSQIINTNSASYTFSACSSMDSTYYINDTLNLLCDSTWFVRIPTLEDTRCASSAIAQIDTLVINTPKPSEFTIDTVICISDTLDINGTLFYLGNASYTDTIQGSQCDSIINITVNFSDIDTIYENPIICPGDSLNIRGLWYSENNQNDEINIINPAGCDSLLIIALSFYEQPDSTISRMLCNGDSIIVNGTTYDDGNPRGVEILDGLGMNGCDSIVTIDLTFASSVMLSRTDTLCNGDSVIIQGVVFNNQNTSDQFLLDNGGCDTMLTVDLTFLDLPEGDVTGTFCLDYSIEVNGTTYDIQNPSGSEIISGGSTLGCDSLVTIDLEFRQPAVFDLNQTICDSDFIIVNGSVYDSSNISGVEILPIASSFGCDSTINIQLTILRTDRISESIEICTGDSLFVGGTWQFDSGIYIDTLTSQNQCDSIVTTELTVNSCDFNVNVALDQVLCFSDSTGSILMSILTMFSDQLTCNWSGLSTGLSGSFIIENLGDFEIENLPADDYNIIITDINNMILWESTETIINSNPPITGIWSIVDSIPCAGETGTIEFTPEGGQEPYVYDWTPNTIGDSPTGSNLVAANYSLIVTDFNNCTLETSFALLEPAPLDASIVIFGTSCEDVFDGEIVIENINGGNGNYTITINNEPAEPISTGLQSGTYDIVITDSKNCNLSFNEELLANPSFELANYTTSYIIQEGDSAVILGSFFSDDLTFLWNDPNGDLSCIDCALPTITPTSDGSYEVTITDISGCTETFTITVEVEVLEIKTVAPNIFSPNGDGINEDFVYTNLSSNVIGISLDIYDRWGNRVHFNTVDGNTISWNGTSNGSKVSSGVYIYTLNILQNDGTTKSIFGDVLIMY